MFDWPTAGVVIAGILGVAAPLFAALVRRPPAPKADANGRYASAVEFARFEAKVSGIDEKLDDFIHQERANWDNLYRLLAHRGVGASAPGKLPIV